MRMGAVGDSVITVKEARKILGQKARALNDDQITELIDTLELLAQYEISVIGSKNETTKLRS